MTFLPDSRGVSEVLGTILVFGLVVMVMTAIQVAGVPAANQEVEFEHSVRVQGDMQDLDTRITQAGSLDTEGAVALETGVRYPPRFFFLNPGPTAGTIVTSDADQVTISNVKTQNAETDEFLVANGGYAFDTRTIAYAPSYNELHNAPTTRYEHGVLYNVDDGGDVAVFDTGSIIDGRRVSLTAIEGDLSASSTQTVNVRAVPISAPATTVSVTDDGSPITLTVYTGLSENEWKANVLADEWDPSDTSTTRHVRDIQCVDQADVDADLPCNGPITITLDKDVTYNLRLAKVGVGSGFEDESPAYVTKVAGVDPIIDRSGSVFTVQVRDQFNNGVAGVEVEFTSSDGSGNDAGNFLDELGDGHSDLTVRTDENGVASVKFKPESDKVEATIDATAEFDGATGTSPLETVQYTEVPIETSNDDQEDLRNNVLNPSGSGLVVLTDASIENPTGNDPSYVDVSFENRIDEDWTLQEVRINFYYIGSSSGNNKAPESAQLVLPDGGTETLIVGGDFSELDQTIAFSGGSFGAWETTTLTFTDWKKADGTDFDPQDQELFAVTLLFDTGDENTIEDERGTYIILARSA